MNYIEARALRWISKYTSVEETEIRYSNNTSPDFTAPDGQGFEIKHYFPPDRRIMIYPRQWLSLLQVPNCLILIFGNGEEPDAIIPISALPFGTKRWHQFGIDCQETNRGSIPRDLYLEKLRIKTESRNKKAAGVLTNSLVAGS